jgi:Ion channel
VITVVIAGLVLMVTILWDTFEAVILPRRIRRKIRVTNLVYALTWPLWSYIPRRSKKWKKWEHYLSWYGPLSMFFLLAVWAFGLIISFAILHWGLRSPLKTPEGESGLLVDLYMSGSTFFTLGLGDVTPNTPLARVLTVMEAGLGFGFLALVIGYLPVLYTAFSKREAQITMLDARAGSPPTAAEILMRTGTAGALASLQRLMADWEVMGAETLETHISYPALLYYRSHHTNQSWVVSFAAMLDVCALVIAGIEKVDKWQAQLTFAMLRHSVVDLLQVLNCAPGPKREDRLPEDERESLYAYLDTAGVHCIRTPEAAAKLEKLRSMYEPYVAALCNHLVLPMPGFTSSDRVRDNWKTSAFQRAEALPDIWSPNLDAGQDGH